jgi:hypothetical protein
VNRPTIITSSWNTKLPDADLFTAAPESYARVGISRGGPRGQSGFRMYRPLQPGAGTLGLPAAEFTERYWREVLGRLDAQRVVDELLALADGKVVVLCCFEHPYGEAWCHRALVSAWFEVELDLSVPEFGREAEGHGLSHPKLCAAARSFLTRVNG